MGKRRLAVDIARFTRQRRDAPVKRLAELGDDEGHFLRMQKILANGPAPVPIVQHQWMNPIGPANTPIFVASASRHAYEGRNSHSQTELVVNTPAQSAIGKAHAHRVR